MKFSLLSASALLVVTAAFGARKDDPSLSFEVPGHQAKRFSIGELSKSIRHEAIEIYDVVHKKRKRYNALPLREVLRFGFKDALDSGELSEIAFLALDGYQSLASKARALEEGGYLAFEDLDGDGSWEKISRKKSDPGPFYVVWSKPGQSTKDGYPWPYQLAMLKLVRFEEAFPEVVPRGISEREKAWTGFEVFKDQCFRCHAINRQGGKIGPDLNAPRSIVQYRSEKMIREMIRQPSKYRYTHMPDHLHLSQEQIDGLIEYFKVKSRQPEKDWK